MSPKQRTALMALGSVVGGILLVVSVVVVARDLQHKNPKKTSLVAGGDTTTVPALGQEDTSTTGVSVPGITIVSPTSAPGAGVPTLAPVVTTAPPAVTAAPTTTTMPPGPVAGGGASVLLGMPGAPTPENGSLSCRGLTTYKYTGTDPTPACGDALTGDNNKYRLYWVIEPGKPAHDSTSRDDGVVVSVWGQDQTAGSSSTWALKLQAKYPASKFNKPLNPIAVSMAVPSGPPQLAFGFHEPGNVTSVHVDVVQVTGSGPGAAVAVGLHVDANLANASQGKLDAFNNGSHQVIQFYKGAWRVQHTDTAAAGNVNL